MNQIEAKRKAHLAVAALVSINYSTGDGDLWGDTEDYSAADLERFKDEIKIIIHEHLRRGHAEKRRQ